MGLSLLTILIAMTVMVGNFDFRESSAAPTYIETGPNTGRYLSDDNHATQIYFLLFSAETVTGVTQQSIEKTNHYVIRFAKVWPIEVPLPRHDEHPFIKQLRTILVARKSDQARLKENFIRLKVRFPDATFYADQSGTVWKEGTKEFYQLSLQGMKTLTERIAEYAGVVDMKA
jgi:hypothetical protein